MIRRTEIEIFNTEGVLEAIDADELWMLAGIALQKMTPVFGGIDFIIFVPGIETHLEDRTRLVQRIDTIPRTVWAKLDDYQSPEILSRELGYETKARYVLTMLLPEEY